MDALSFDLIGFISRSITVATERVCRQKAKIGFAMRPCMKARRKAETSRSGDTYIQRCILCNFGSTTETETVGSRTVTAVNFPYGPKV